MYSVADAGMLHSSLETHAIAELIDDVCVPATDTEGFVNNTKKSNDMKDIRLIATILGILALYVAFYFAMYWLTDYCLRHYL